MQTSLSRLKGTLQIPSSKSHTLRAILFASLSQGQSRLYDVLPSSDTLSMIHACENLGAQFDKKDDVLLVSGTAGKLSPALSAINVGNSGQVLRFVSALSALSSHPRVFFGDASIHTRRSIAPLISGLHQMGASAISAYNNGYAPLLIKGKAQPSSICISGQDSQPVSALLMLASFLDGKSHIQVENPGEAPWVNLTLDWLKKLGGCIEKSDLSYAVTGPITPLGFQIRIPGDWSSAAFPLIAALITQSEITLENLDVFDTQGDKALLDVLLKMGAHIEVDPEKKTIRVFRHNGLKGVCVDINDFIDSIAALAVLGCYAQGSTILTGAGNARNKESNRIDALCSELKKMGAKIEPHKDGLKIDFHPLHSACVFSHHDHRIAMALAVAGMGITGTTQISHAECIQKSYPDFCNQMQSLGANIRL